MSDANSMHSDPMNAQIAILRWSTPVVVEIKWPKASKGVVGDDSFARLLIEKGEKLRRRYRQRVGEPPPRATGEPIACEIEYQRALMAALYEKEARKRGDAHEPVGRPQGSADKTPRTRKRPKPLKSELEIAKQSRRQRRYRAKRAGVDIKNSK